MDDTGEPKPPTPGLTSATVSWAGAPREPLPQPPGAPQSVRYAALGQLGAGGMGVVYLAHDRELNRRVALKILRPESRSAAADARLQREAQAMARLDHPNVVAVYDVGRLDEGQVFVAMELVEGQSLRKWLAEEPRAPREILRTFIEAGRGLSAAHEAGLVHRDFKPDNVLIGKDGVVRVADFGLARVTQEGLEPQGAPDAAPAQGGPPLPDSFIEPLTRTGAMVGTPLYMAPEQLRGEASDARSDQFGFCVALYEALYGQRPFEATTALNLLTAIQAGPARPPRGSKVPARLFPVLRRGLDVEPARRWPSVDALLVELLRDPGRTRLRALGATLGALLIVFAALLGLKTSRERDQLCKGAERKLRGVWDADRKAALRAAFAATRLAYAGVAAEQAEKNLDAYAKAFVGGHQEACEATQLRGEQSASVEDLRMTCLEGRRGALASLVDELVKADAKVVDRAPRATLGLPELASCADVAALQTPAPLPPGAEVRRQIAAIGKEVGRADALRLAGRFAEGRKVAAQAVAEAQKTSYAPLLAEAQLALGILDEDSGDLKSAEEHLQDSLFTAMRGHAEEVALRAATALAIDVGRAQNRIREGRLWARLAQSTLPRVGSGRDETRLEQAIGLIDYADGKFADAGRHYQRALELSETLFGAASVRRADLLNSLGGVANALGHYDEAERLYAGALQIYEATFGKEHPQVGTAISNLATISFVRGRYAEAEAGFQRVCELYEKNLGPGHPRLAAALLNLAEAVLKERRIPEAIALQRRSLSISIAALGEDHPTNAKARVNLASSLLMQGAFGPARAEVQRALQAQIAKQGDAHPDLMRTLGVLGDVDRADGKLEAAQQDYDRALAIGIKALGEDHRDVADLLLSRAELALDRGDPQAALAGARRAQAAFEKGHGKEGPDAALASGVAGRALLAKGDPKGRQELEAALATWERLGGNGPRGDRLRASVKAVQAAYRH